MSSETFYFGMITAEFFGYRNYDLDLKAETLEAQLHEALGRPDDALIGRYALLVMYTQRFHFNWHPQAPEYIRSLEGWWDMVESGKSKADCYLYFCEAVPNDVARGYIVAMEKAHRPWRPPEARPDSELTAEELADPNLPSAAEPSVTIGGAG